MSVQGVPVAMPGFHSPGAGFEAPFEMLAACHQRVERMLDLLERMRLHADQHGCDTQVQQAARDVMRYFDQAAPLHHQDEELHVFPAVLAGADARAHAVVAQLLAQHRQMEPLWAQLRGILLQMATPAVAAALSNPLQAATVQTFAALYRDHIALEEQVAYPAAQAVMGPQQIQTASEDMMQRRGVQPLAGGNRP